MQDYFPHLKLRYLLSVATSQNFGSIPCPYSFRGNTLHFFLLSSRPLKVFECETTSHCLMSCSFARVTTRTSSAPSNVILPLPCGSICILCFTSSPLSEHLWFPPVLRLLFLLFLNNFCLSYKSFYPCLILITPLQIIWTKEMVQRPCAVSL